MFMQRIRHATIKHRKVLIVVVILLAVGLVGSFAVWGAADNPGVNNSSDLSTAEQIELYENYIAQTPVEGEDIYANAGLVADAYMALYSLYGTAYSEVIAEDSALAEEYQAKALAAAASAAEYYQMQLDNAADEVTDYEKAGIIGNKAMALACTDDADAARAAFEEGLALAPNNYDLAVYYLSFLYQTDGLEAAQAYAASYMELVGEESSFYTQMQTQIQTIEEYEQALQDFYEQLEQLQNENQDDEEAADDTGSGDEDAADGTDESATNETAN